MAKVKKAATKRSTIKTAPDPPPPVSAEAGGESRPPISASCDSREDASKRGRIALLAYQYWEQRGCPAGSPDEDWFRAEREIDFSTGEK